MIHDFFSLVTKYSHVIGDFRSQVMNHDLAKVMKGHDRSS